MGKLQPGVSSYSQANALLFNGTTGYCSRADAAAHDFTTAMTISVWLKGANPATFVSIAGKSDVGANKRTYVIFNNSDVTTGWGYIVSADGGATNYNYQKSATTVFDSTWHHLVYTFSADTNKMYADRVLETVLTTVADGTCNSLYNSDVGLIAGAQWSSGSAAFFLPGRLTNLSLWNVALDQTGVSALAAAGKPADLSLHANYANCVSWYKMGDGDGVGADGIVDTKGGLHLSVTGGVTIVADAV
jgi:hypothetical protein